MHVLLWVLQDAGALVHAASSTMKVFMFDAVSGDVPSFGGLPRPIWTALGLIELVSVVGLIVPPALQWKSSLVVVAAAILAAVSLVFVWVHVQYREVAPIVMSGALGLVMAFVAYGRAMLAPL